MIDLIFPDGSKRQYDDGATGRAVAHSSAPSLSKRAVLVKLDGELLDLVRGRFSVTAYEARMISQPKMAMVQRIAARLL